uniref:cytochrome b n=1 Tax=Mosgovoyia sp. SQ20 TaxID=2854040 RepID=UPI001F135289|nr:cytochrome b [Mosgovoyia sp. SQ20]UKS07999.1 cytochrome b [Mosgovoyia sp. SQ20]
MLEVIRRNLIDLPTNYSLSYYWCSGFMISIFMVLQILTGVVLSFLYVADSLVSFSVVMGLTNDSFYTWCLRYWHMWGVNVLFFLFFVHISRSLYYSSYSKKGVWNVGFILYLLLMGEAFTGYILPWHQMSYWAATVLTSVVDSLPVFGPTLYKYVVGGFGVTDVTLIRIFSVHVCLGFVILGLMVVHMYYLHKVGSNNPLFSYSSFSDLVYFHSYFSVKDFMCFVVVCALLFFVLFFMPDALVDIESYLEADAMVTPVSIKPEWYFLVFYCILRCIDSKIGGLALILSFLFFLWVPTFNEASVYFFLRQLVFWCIISLFVSLTYLGSCHPEYPYLFVCKLFSFFMVAFMFIFKLFWLGSGAARC